MEARFCSMSNILIFTLFFFVFSLLSSSVLLHFASFTLVLHLVVYFFSFLFNFFCVVMFLLNCSSLSSLVLHHFVNNRINPPVVTETRPNRVYSRSNLGSILEHSVSYTFTIFGPNPHKPDRCSTLHGVLSWMQCCGLDGVVVKFWFRI